MLTNALKHSGGDQVLQMPDADVQPNFRLATEAELVELAAQGIVLRSGLDSRVPGYSWEDGQYGIVNCSHGKCNVYMTDTPKEACLGCVVDGHIEEIGACRPRLSPPDGE